MQESTIVPCCRRTKDPQFGTLANSPSIVVDEALAHAIDHDMPFVCAVLLNHADCLDLLYILRETQAEEHAHDKRLMSDAVDDVHMGIVAASRGHLGIVRTMHAHQRPWNLEACIRAADSTRQTAVSWWLRALLDCPVDDETPPPLIGAHCPLIAGLALPPVLPAE